LTRILSMFSRVLHDSKHHLKHRKKEVSFTTEYTEHTEIVFRVFRVFRGYLHFTFALNRAARPSCR